MKVLPAPAVTMVFSQNKYLREAINTAQVRVGWANLGTGNRGNFAVFREGVSSHRGLIYKSI